jgi:3-dehydroquinate synthase
MVEENENLSFTTKVNTNLSNKLREEDFSQIFVLVDDNTKDNCLPLIIDSLPKTHHLIQIDHGEENKVLTTCEKIWQYLTDKGADRHTLLINLGGGVICDMGGFCARTYKRGIRFWNIPTTVLSQVDASVGGKLGIDFGEYKNHIGLFSDPDQVYIDSTFLTTLPQDEILSGYAEMVKHSLIKDAAMFTELQLLDINKINWSDWIKRSVSIKKDIVEHDPTEKGLRKILNFGHTIGHAIESYYLNKGLPLKHGEAVAIGMITETFLSVQKKYLSESEGNAVIQYLLKVFPNPPIDESSIEDIIKNASHDKKNLDNKIKAVLLKSIGEAFYDADISNSDIRSAIVYYNQLVK